MLMRSLLAVLLAAPLFAQTPRIASISVGNEQLVLAPNGEGINKFVNGGVSDEHQSVFPPGSLNGNPDYLFFVASKTSVNSDTGLLVLSGGSGPNANGQWTMDFARADGYGVYPPGNAQIFLSPVGRGCPTVTDGNAAHQDPTFDLNYAAPGSIVIDPTGAPGSLLMIYEGTITCFGITGGARSQNFYSTVGVATSHDFGKTWPAYRGTSTFNFVPLPGQNTQQGPHAPSGALGGNVCAGTDCSSTPPAAYGRYAVLSPSISVATAMATGTPLASSLGDSEMAAFVDDVSPGAARFVYATYNFGPGAGALVDPQQTKGDLMIARAQLNGGSAPLTFLKWNGQNFGAPGIGGIDAGIFPSGAFQNCEGSGQLRVGSSINYVDDAQRYLLTFVCNSPGDPSLGSSGGARGAAWFYSTSDDLSDPRRWTPPQEIAGSWSEFDPSATTCGDYQGWYPTLMSPGKPAGHLATTGYVFYLWGCQTADTPPPGRQYSSRAFTITLARDERRRAVRH